jgi:DNA adenine methylase
MTKPFLKWAGGKRWLAPHIASLFESHRTSRYVEPFLGGGAVFFATKPHRALLADSNEDLVLTFAAVRDNPEYLVRSLSHRKISQASFERVRLWKPSDPLDRAVRLIYLNRTAFNGLFRVNRKGIFNVPYGCKTGTKACDPDHIHAASEALRQAKLHVADFRDTLHKVRSTDILYVDPPYTVRHDNNGFRRYNEQIFSWQDQLDLADSLKELARRGTAIVVSNAAHRDVRRLYSGRSFVCWEVRRPSLMAADPGYRGSCTELVLLSEAAWAAKSNGGNANTSQVLGKQLVEL